MPDRSAPRRRLNIDAAVWWGLYLLAGGVMLYAMLVASGCASTSQIAPATSSATRTTESKGPRRELIVRGYPAPKEAGK